MSAPGAALLTRPPAESGGRSLAAQLLLALICGGYAVGAALGWGSSEIAEIMGDFGLSAAGILAAVSCYSYARSIDRRERPAWLLFAFSSLMGACGNAVWGWYEVVLGEPVPKPSLADFAFLCFAPPAIVG
ncbi:phosphodiesterase, partial [Streptomyces goshikiensis]